MMFFHKKGWRDPALLFPSTVSGKAAQAKIPSFRGLGRDPVTGVGMTGSVALSMNSSETSPGYEQDVWGWTVFQPITRFRYGDAHDPYIFHWVLRSSAQLTTIPCDHHDIHMNSIDSIDFIDCMLRCLHVTMCAGGVFSAAPAMSTSTGFYWTTDVKK